MVRYEVHLYDPLEHRNTWYSPSPALYISLSLVYGSKLSGG